MKLPNRKRAHNCFDAMLGNSVAILMNVKGYHGLMIGEYHHTVNKWWLDQTAESVEDDQIIEWWLLPKIGTGEK